MSFMKKKQPSITDVCDSALIVIQNYALESK